jgi:hypothetical protein
MSSPYLEIPTLYDVPPIVVAVRVRVQGWDAGRLKCTRSENALVLLGIVRRG